MFINTDPTSHLLQVSDVILGHADVRLEEVAKGVETGRHRIYDDMGCFVEEQTGLLVVCEVVR